MNRGTGVLQRLIQGFRQTGLNNVSRITAQLGEGMRQQKRSALFPIPRLVFRSQELDTKVFCVFTQIRFSCCALSIDQRCT